MNTINEIQKFLAENTIILKVIYCVLLVVAGFALHYFSKRWLKRLFEKRVTPNLMRSKKIQTLSTFLLSTVKYFIYFIIFYFFCKILNVPIDSVFIAIAGASSVAFGLGAQTLVKNIINGFFILIEDEYSVGDMIHIDSFQGTVEEIGIRTTKIRSIDGNLHIIPNGEINIVTNMTKKMAFAVVEVNLPYETDANKVIEVLGQEMAENTAEIDGLLNPPKVLGISALGQYCYTIKIMADAELTKFYGVERDIRLKVKNRLDAEGIAQPSISAAVIRERRGNENGI